MNIWVAVCYVLAVLIITVAEILISCRLVKLERRLHLTIKATTQALDNIRQMFVAIHERLKTLETEAEEE